MLKIERTGPGRYTALSGGEELGHCCFQAGNGVITVTELCLSDKTDIPLLDGLLRAALLLGEPETVSAVITSVAAAGLERAIGALGMPIGERFSPDALPKQCAARA